MALYAVSGVLIAYALWAAVSELWVHEEYVDASLVVAVTIVAILVWFLHRNRPRDKFQFFHPWRIQETTTPRDLWLIAGFDTLVGLATIGVFFAPRGTQLRKRDDLLCGHSWRDGVSHTPERVSAPASSVRLGRKPRGSRRSSNSAEIQGLLGDTSSADAAGGSTYERSGIRRAASRVRSRVLRAPQPAYGLTSL